MRVAASLLPRAHIGQQMARVSGHTSPSSDRLEMVVIIDLMSL